MLIGSVSALSVSPNELTFNAYPGESIFQNATIYADGYINLSNTFNESITLIYPNNLSISGNQLVQIEFQFNESMNPGIYNIRIDIQSDENQPISHVSSSGGSYVCLVNGKLNYTYPCPSSNNKTSIKNESYTNISENIIQNKTIQQTNKQKFSGLMQILITIGVIILVFIFIILIMKGGKHETKKSEMV